MDNPLLLTPGPTPIHPAAQAALMRPMVGHMDPVVFEINTRIQKNLRVLYGADETSFTALIAGTGSLGMDSGFSNLLEPGDHILVCANGSFGQRMAEMSVRYGAKVTLVEAPIGQAIDLEAVEKAIQFEPKMVAVVHGETSTGVLNPAPEIAQLTRNLRTLSTVDAVTTAGMMPYHMTDWNIDYAYTGSQKCLSAPPGVAPVAVSQKALAAFAQRKTPAPLWYSDFEGLRDYWDKQYYHHTIPVQLHYALDAALQAALDEGLEARAERARSVGLAVAETLAEIGFSYFVREAAHRLPSVLALRLPSYLDDLQVRTALREKGINITGGLGATSGKIWRLGLMGEAARVEHYQRFMKALGEILHIANLESRFIEIYSQIKTLA